MIKGFELDPEVGREALLRGYKGRLASFREYVLTIWEFAKIRGPNTRPQIAGILLKDTQK